MTPRYCEVPFPSYRHFPGITIHPDRNRAEHDLGKPDPRPPSLNDVSWQECASFLYGIDLFNAGYWWECHEIMEGLWFAAGKTTMAGRTLQAIIQCAAAHLKTTLDQPIGARRLFSHANRHVGQVGSLSLGIDLIKMLEATEAYVIGDQGVPASIKLGFETPGDGKSDQNGV